MGSEAGLKQGQAGLHSLSGMLILFLKKNKMAMPELLKAIGWKSRTNAYISIGEHEGK
jgi:hypothetical protein